MHINKCYVQKIRQESILGYTLSYCCGVYSQSHKFYIPISILVKAFESGLHFLLCGVWYTPDDVNKLAWGERKENNRFSLSSIFVAHL